MSFFDSLLVQIHSQDAVWMRLCSTPGELVLGSATEVKGVHALGDPSLPKP